jgi:type IV secretory system conjugative DNA transfer VirD4/TraG family protein
MRLPLFPNRKPAITQVTNSIRTTWPDDLPFVKFSAEPEDVWTLRDAFQSILIMGEHDAGKTSASGHLFARKYLQHGFGGLILCNKNTEAARWKMYLEEAGREADGRFFSPDSDFRFNFLEYESQFCKPGFDENLVTLLLDLASLRQKDDAGGGGNGGSDATFWLPQRANLVRNIIAVLRMAEEPIELHHLYQIILSAPKSRDEVFSPDWQRDSFLNTLLKRAEKNRTHLDWQLTMDYWLREYPAINDKTRSLIEAHLKGILNPLVRGQIGELFGTTTNLTPDDILDGKVVVVDISVDEYREIGQYAGLIWSQLFQRKVERRRYDSPNTRPVFLWVDEAHKFTIPQDAEFQSTARSHGISVVRLTQNLPNFLDAYGSQGRHKVDTLLGNHTLKIFHRNSEPVTNKWASEVIAKDIKYKHSMSISGSLNMPNERNTQSSVSEVEEDSCPPRVFLGLRNGGPRYDQIVDGVVFQSGRLFEKDRRWVIRQFRQQGPIVR